MTMTSPAWDPQQYNRFERASTNDWTDYRSRPTTRSVRLPRPWAVSIVSETKI